MSGLAGKVFDGFFATTFRHSANERGGLAGSAAEKPVTIDSTENEILNKRKCCFGDAFQHLLEKVFLLISRAENTCLAKQVYRSSGSIFFANMAGHFALFRQVLYSGFRLRYGANN